MDGVGVLGFVCVRGADGLLVAVHSDEGDGLSWWVSVSVGGGVMVGVADGEGNEADNENDAVGVGVGGGVIVGVRDADCSTVNE